MSPKDPRRPTEDRPVQGGDRASLPSSQRMPSLAKTAQGLTPSRAFPANEDTGIHDTAEQAARKIAHRLKVSERDAALRHESMSTDLVQLMVQLAEQNLTIDRLRAEVAREADEAKRLREAKESEAKQREDDARAKAIRDEEHRSRRALALIAIFGPIVSSIITAIAVLLATASKS